MTSEVEPAKKILLPYLQRADELQKHEPLVAYYSRLYAMERGLKIPVKERTKTTNAILVSLMKQLEKDKKLIQLSPEDNLYVEGFALNVFAKADKQDRAGRADLNTAKTFYAASIFIEILHQFGPLQPDIEQKQKYAVWKAADIRKALSEGRKAVPGPPAGDDNASTSPGSMDLEGSPRYTTASGLHGRSSIQDNSTEGFEVSSPDSENPSMLQQDHQYAAGPDQRIWQQTGSAYTSAYPGSFHPVPSMPEHTLPSSMAPSQHGSTDDYNGHHGSMDGHYSAPIYQEYPQIVASQYESTDGFNVHHGSTDGHHGAPLYQHGSADGLNVHHGSTDGHPQATASRQMYTGGPTRYVAGNEAAAAAYYQLQGHAPSAVSYSAAGTVAYPAAAPFSAAEYCSVVGSSDLSALDRTTSAPSSSIQVQNYQPTSENIADAQKAARLSVSSLAFDDVPTAVSYLKQSLELLTARAST